MPGKGFAPAPTAIKLARGERRPSRVNYDEPELDAPSSFEAPVGLKGPGLREWKGQIQQLSDRGVLTTADLTAFEDYCRALTDLRGWEAETKRQGRRAALMSGAAGMVVKVRAQVSQLRQQCGLTPSSRSGVKAAKKKEPASANPAARYLSALQGGKST